MRPLRSSLLAFALAAVALPQAGTEIVPESVRRVGSRLACKCGACNNTVGNCPMLQCHSASPARERIAELQKQGKSDDQIVDTFVQESGIVALAEPPAKGFNLLGYLMPFIAIVIGLGAIWAFMKRAANKPAPAGVQPVDDALLARYRDRIDKDLAKLD